MLKLNNLLSIIFLNLSAIFLVGLQIKPLSWTILGAGTLITLLFCNKQFRKNIILIYISLALLGITPISTNIEMNHFLIMAGLMLLVVTVPYFIAKYVYKNNDIRFGLHNAKGLRKIELLYVLLIALAVYLVFPFALRNSGSYLNWTVELNSTYLVVFFIGLNLVGAWDEFFFINTVLNILRRHLTFWIANFTQSVIFTSFLYALGFRGWTFLLIFLFAFLQGRIFQKTNSLLYLISIHLAADFILYLVLIHAYYPNHMPIFLIK